MRRARIKAVANVQTRRKTAQELPVLLPSQSSNPPETSKNLVRETTIQTATIGTIPEKVNHGTDDSKKAIKIPNSQIMGAHQTDQIQNKEISGPTQVTISRSHDNTLAVLGSLPSISDPISSKSPASPAKLMQNRSRFVKPVPRLDGSGRIRRSSIQGSGASASESEDDNKRLNYVLPCRMRNDSCGSIQSNKEPTASIGLNNISETRPAPKRRMVISESARKLAEARREFLHKHGNKAPDRNKLTMYDLIYYNPVTNPMKAQDKGVEKSREDSFRSVNDCIAQDEENVDEPYEMPVPQVKVGPDGQLIIDEQSLVIEQTGTKKGREALAKTEVVVDEGRSGNGFYKRPRKTKDWPKWETLRFYTALNTIGTDFLLMQSLFPDRSRQEIKLKFKKEEKTNRTLVEKALKYHQEFDMDALEQELATFEEREKLEREEKKKAKESKSKEKKRSKTKKKRKCAFVTSSIEQGDETGDEEGEQISDSDLADAMKCEKSNNSSIKKIKTGGKCKNDMSMDEALDDLMQGAGIFSDLESDTEIYEVKPTRSGRCPRSRKFQEFNMNKFDKTYVDDSTKNKENHENVSIRSGTEDQPTNSIDSSKESQSIVDPPKVRQRTIPDITKVEPGSLVILSSEAPGEPGRTMLQVYMVSPNLDPTDVGVKQSMAPVDLPSELLATVTTKISQSETPDS
ncbi:transcription factor TFIIIB component B'' homolog [Athalia rosae]|uniref:transcription factor TFIIIB component B'' homolog n=1 Tax=Athalia rosae TaxID=37344 RepID=UPI0020347F5D|nr:transcription factor TFIIIB component B'' homolog [Athalia rosae]XP_012268076.2 transcription factor TFIIIB component B'' homolog [Athalia rosae]XP_012268078.2 transcription factor TFIIIB component B'' homolog [Athalia rosae]XP_048509757.1 transcription factor TFIIIB component B'' homolog [Athalia rosae]